MNWITQTVLALDLDLTLIRPAPISEIRPTLFPLLYDREFRLQSRLGKKYIGRGDLDALDSILGLPWRAKLLFSMSMQDKVDEVAQCLTIGDRPLVERVDACVGAELLNEFADSRQVLRPSYTDISLSNPTGRRVVAKPLDFIFLENISALGTALRTRERSRARDLVRNARITRSYGLVIDDQPYFEPRVDTVVCYQVIPFEPIEHFSVMVAHLQRNPSLRFQVLDHLWRTISRPFGFLAVLLQKSLSWQEFTKLASLDYRLAETLCRCRNTEELSHALGQVISVEAYREYRDITGSCGRNGG